MFCSEYMDDPGSMGVQGLLGSGFMLVQQYNTEQRNYRGRTPFLPVVFHPLWVGARDTDVLLVDTGFSRIIN